MAATNNYYQVFEKPIQHLGLDDWFARTNQLCNLADVRHSDAFEVRQSSRCVRNESAVQTHWETVHNNSRISNRVFELNRWLEEMRICMDRIVREINALRVEKNATESDLDALDVPLTVVTECLSQRDVRVIGELTQDDAVTELKRELKMIESNKKMLIDQCQMAWERLNRLVEIKNKLNTELVNKEEARTCDYQQRMLTDHSAGVTFKTDPMRNPKNSCTYQGWLDHSNQIKKLTAAELDESSRMRESLFVARERVKNALRTQQEGTEHVLRKRIFDTQRARNEFEWQIIKTKDEMKQMLNEIEAIERSLQINGDAQKLAETRLENRCCQRSGMELCMDDVYTGLCDELKRLKQTEHQLTDKLNASKTTYTALEAHLVRLENDLKRKQHTLMTDIRALDLRQRLKADTWRNDNDFTPTNGRNLQLTQLNGEIRPS